MFECFLCKVVSSYKGAIETHLKRHHRISDLPDTVCPFCLSQYSNKANCERHMVTCNAESINNTKERQKCFNCDKCYKILSSPRSYNNHILTCKEIENPLQCHFCKKTFASASSKSTHVKTCRTSSAAIRNYGEEDLSYITSEELDAYVRDTRLGVLNLIREVHFNPNKSMNHNIMGVPKKSKFVAVFKENKWHLEDVHHIIENLITKYSMLLFRHYDSSQTLQEADKDHNNTMLESLVTVSTRTSSAFHHVKRSIIATLANMNIMKERN